MAEKVGVYICHCGSNIGGVVDCPEVAKWARENLEDVVVSRDYKFMCSALGQDLIKDDIAKEGLTRVVVGACSPHLHEKTFRNASKAGGLNPYLMQMTNLREHVSWVTADKAAATGKSKSLISGAVHRVVHQEALAPMPVPVNDHTLVVGAGIAGIQAALEIADAGYHVYLLEREPSIGGHMAKFDKTFPTLDCSACILAPKMSDIDQHENIELLTYSELESLSGYVGNFKANIRKRPRMVVEPDCTGCGLCIEKCPKRVVDTEFEAGIGYRKAIYRPFPQAVPKIPVIDVENCTYFVRGKCKACEKFCPTGAVDFKQVEEVREVDVGNVILATGWKPFDARRVSQYGYGRMANVFTSLEFERMCNSAGPTDGKIVMRDGVTEPKSVAIVHCVGSRDENYNPYCSGVCCMAALKFGHLVLEKTDAEVTSFYIDLRTNQKGYEEFYARLLDEGMNFVRGKVAEITDAARYPGEEGKIILQAEDTLLGRQRRHPVDMVILMGALEPRDDSKELGIKVGVSCSMDGWFTERHPKLDPVATMTDGIFVAGSCQGPKDIPASVAQGAAAAARVVGMINRKSVMVEPVVASINDEKCSGCRICNTLCPYGAITFDVQKSLSGIETALCKGCGTCVSGCPANAISGAHFSNAQIEAELDGILFEIQQGAATGEGAPLAEKGGRHE
jgi:heterodisulfide reductase subunit A2